MARETIQVEIDGPIATLRFNRPEKLNAFSRQLVAETMEALAELQADTAVRVVILCGAGRAFSAGYDLGGGDGNRPQTVVDYKARMDDNQFAEAIWNFKKPIIASVHSYCLAGACEIAAFCDMTIAADDARFGEPDIRFATGSPPAIIFPLIMPLKAAKQLIYEGGFMSAQRALELGLVNEVVPRDQLEKRTRYHALLISRVAPLALQLAKEAVNKTVEMQGLMSALAYSRNLVAILDGSETEEGRKFEEIREAEGLKAALDWRDGLFREVEAQA